MAAVSRPKFALVAVSIVVAFGGNFSFGYNTILNPAEDVFKQFLNETYYRRYGSAMPDSEFSFIWSAIFALPTLGAFLGLFFVPYLAEKLGRKWTIILNNVPTILSSLLMLVSHKYFLMELFLVGRLLWGINMGVGTSIMGIFLTECSPRQFRGLMASLQELALCAMCTFAITLGTPAFLGTYRYLDIMLVLPIVPALLQVVVMLLVPDTPRHLLLTKADESAAQKSIAFYHGADADMQSIEAEFVREREVEARTKMSLRQCLEQRHVRRGILIGVAANVANVLSGIAVYYAYSTDMVIRAGVPVELAKYSTVLMTVLNTLATLVSIFFIDRLGRRQMLLSSLFLCLACNVCYFSFAELANHVQGTWSAFLSCGFIVLHSVVFSVGTGPIAWFITSELVPQAARSTAQSIAMGANFLGQLIDLLVFYPLFYQIGTYSFLLVHILPSVFVIGILYLYMPETKDREISEIVASLMSSSAATAIGATRNVAGYYGSLVRDPKALYDAGAVSPLAK